jgi:hypothetical protein
MSAAVASLRGTWGQWCDKLFMRRWVVSFTKFFAKGNGGIMRPIATAKARHDRYHQQTEATTNKPRLPPTNRAMRTLPLSLTKGAPMRRPRVVEPAKQVSGALCEPASACSNIFNAVDEF